MEKTREGDDYDVMSFEDFCNKSDKLKNILLPENENINYRLCYENDPSENPNNKELKEDSSGLEETSLCNDKKVPWKKRAAGLVPFVRAHHSTNDKIETPKTTIKFPRYERFEEQRNTFQRFCKRPEFYSSLLIVVLLLALSIGMWSIVCWFIGNAWGDAHYKKLWERAHPDDLQRRAPAPPVMPYAHDKNSLDFRYHDHNNLSTRNKAIANQKKSQEPCVMDRNKKFDCYPQDKASKDMCMKRGCCWDDSVPNNIPFCFYPSDYALYTLHSTSGNHSGLWATYKNVKPSGYPDDFKVVHVKFNYVSSDILQIKIEDANNTRFEPPFPQVPVDGRSHALHNSYSVTITAKGFTVKNLHNNHLVMNVDDAGALILSDKFLQLSTTVPPGKFYGLGERRSRLELNWDWTTYTIFNHDTPPRDNTNLYGSHPFYMCLSEPPAPNSKPPFYGVLLLNSYPMDILLQPTPAMTYRTIGGILNFYIFFGPTADDVTRQYSEIVGKPFMPPMWGLGFHLSKFNYGSLDIMRQTFEKNIEAKIPIDAQWSDLDYMDNANMFTYDKKLYRGLPEFIKNRLHRNKFRWVPLFDPGVSASESTGKYLPFDRGLEMNIFITNSSGKPFVGKVWNKGSTVWPDFSHPNATSYWTEMMQRLYEEVNFDGAWIDMNEPSNFLSGPKYGECKPEVLPYKPQTDGRDSGLRYKTLCMDAVHYGGTHLDYHNLYSSMEAVATNFALKEIRDKRPFIISRSSFVGLGQYAGHWSGDVDSSWEDMAMSIPEILRFSMFGVPLMGADICGFRGNTTVELCTRWMQLGAFYPFARNHNSDTSSPQDPASLGMRVLEESRKVLMQRYVHLPHLYNLFWQAHRTGVTVARPVFFEFPEDINTHSIDDQFMLGKDILVTPILKQGAKLVHPYLTNLTEWFTLRGGYKITPGDGLDESYTVLLRAGAIVIGRIEKWPSSNSANMRSWPLKLIVVMPVYNNNNKTYDAEFYFDDEESLNNYEEKRYSLIKFSLNAAVRELTGEVMWWGYGAQAIHTIIFYNVVPRITKIKIQNTYCEQNKLPEYTHVCSFRQTTTTVVINYSPNRSLYLNSNFRLTWEW